MARDSSHAKASVDSLFRKVQPLKLATSVRRPKLVHFLHFALSMRLGLAQINSTVGDLTGNRRKILDAYATPRRPEGGTFVRIRPELPSAATRPAISCSSGVSWPTWPNRSKLIAAAIGDVPAVVGTVEAGTPPAWDGPSTMPQPSATRAR